MNTTLTPTDTGLGNTKPTRDKPRIRGKNWFFTWNNYPDTYDTILLKEFSGAKYTFQEETGEQGTKHIQGCVSFTNARGFEALKKIDKTIHWEQTKDMKAAIAYCSKDDTRTGKLTSNCLPKKVKDPLEGIQLYKWEQDMIDIITKEPHPRKIHWLWESKGNSGKTTFAKHLCIRYKALYVSGKANDIKAALATLVEQGEPPEIIIWDIPRTSQDYVSYEAIESIKNGICFSGKYESKQLIYNIPHVIILANFPPETRRLSEDRWDIKDI